MSTSRTAGMALAPAVAQGETSDDVSARVEHVITKLEAYCRARQWAGIDPYDALNSRLFARTPLAKSRVARLAFTQLLKRSPVNFRPLLGIQPHQNPKALALFLMAYVKLARRGDHGARALASQLADGLLELRSPGSPYWSWGYSFPWQMRTRLVPRFAPNLVCTTFAAEALLDAYEFGLGPNYLAVAASACEYIAKELYWSDGAVAAFAYPLPDIRVPVHNANFLGAALLCRLAKLTNDHSAVDRALAVARYSAASQRENGAWPYGVGSNQQWADNFHTGYNLCALQGVQRHLETSEFEGSLTKGFAFYRDHFLTPRGAPKYFHDRTYPIDIHSAAQSILTLLAFSSAVPQARALAAFVLSWTVRHMWDERGFFCYRLVRGLTIRTSYMRWSQAWMMLALAAVLGSEDGAPQHRIGL